MCTKPEAYDYLIRIAKQPKKQVLTDVLLETLSIIAYKQPVTKIEIEKIRGVKSDHAVNKLVEYNLACEVGRLDAPGRPLLFGTTEEFLRRFSVQKLEDLPGIGPEHAYLHESGRAQCVPVKDDEAVEAFEYLARTEGIICAIESAHAVYHAMQIAPTMSRDDIILICLSGRGDKDVAAIARYKGRDLHE